MSDTDVYEMLWDCSYCSASKLLGKTHRHCPNCGAPQDPKTRYFPPEDEKVAVSDHHFVGADLRCIACGEASSATAKHCGNCGSPLESASAIALKEDQVVLPDSHLGAPTSANSVEGGAGGPKAPAKQPSGKSRWIVLAAVGGALVVIAMLVSFVVWKRSAAFEVVGHRWQRTIDIERYQEVREDAWCDELPEGADGMRREKRERSTKKVPDGEECKVRKKDRGDGTYKEIKECETKYKNEPVYGQHCRYEIKRWKRIRTATNEGQSLSQPPTWPPFELRRSGRCLGHERAGKREASYTLLLREAESKGPREFSLKEERWRSFNAGQSLQAKVRQLSGGLDCSTLAIQS